MKYSFSDSIGNNLAQRRADLRVQALVQRWYENIRSRLPAGSSLVANLEEAAPMGFMVSFRAQTEKETFISEARGSEPGKVVEEAGESLYQRLAQLREGRASFKDKLRKLFSEAS